MHRAATYGIDSCGRNCVECLHVRRLVVGFCAIQICNVPRMYQEECSSFRFFWLVHQYSHLALICSLGTYKHTKQK